MVFQTYHVHCIVGQRIVQGAVYVSVAVQGAGCSARCSLCLTCTVQGAGCSAGGGDSRLPRDPYIPTSPLSTPTHNRFKIVHAAASTAKSVQPFQTFPLSQTQLHSLELQLRLTFSLVHPNRWSPPLLVIYPDKC